MSRDSHADPHHKREAAKYENPIPSREFIHAHLEQRQGPATHPELCAELGLTGEDDIEALRRRLIAMVRDGQLLCSRKGAFGLIDKMDLIKGRVQGHPDGFGFLIPEQGGKDFVLTHRQMRCCFDGDVVLARKGKRDHRGRIEAIITEVLEHNTQELVGRYSSDGGFGRVLPENRRVSHDILIPPGDEAGAEDGDVVVVSIIEQPKIRRQPVGKVSEVLGQHMDPGMEIDIALRTYEIPHTWPYEVEEEITGLSETVDDADKANRIDLRDKAFVTIDDETARDFDDAIYAESIKGGGWKLFVAIADVSHYVEVGSPLDVEARSRGTSVYFPEQVIPMLPEVLSNGLCSLNPKVDRLTLVCEMTVSARGDLQSYRFLEGLIYSHARLTYSKVGPALDPETATEARAEIERDHGAAVLKNITTLRELFKLFRFQRQQRGAIDFETTETRIVFDDDRKIDRIVPSQRNDAHRLVEECMLSANVCAADFLQQLEIPCLYRVHDVPSAERLENLRAYLGQLALDLSGGEKPHARDYQKLLATIAGREDFNLIQTMMLRSMNQAVYQPDNIGHFGLAFEAYTHFTSPIRRYPDLLVHRAIRSVIRSNKKTKLVSRVDGAPKMDAQTIYPYDYAAMLELGEHCSMTERRADEATWDVVAWLKCEYMKDHVGDEFEGSVSSVTNFGLFVQLDDVYVDGLVHVSSLQSDYYQLDETAHRLIGERTRVSYGLGDRLKVRVVRVDLDDRKIDFELADAEVRKVKHPGPAAGKKKAGAKKTGAKKAQSDKPNRKRKRRT
ncbi:ribonuclease R [Saccharospirillum sp. MSK14-1]|uniref:ribonuclease R n=1 Tax=Saccharospirillum sp. MSK14-1 TaxID=1897632 RepID=UPI000D3AE87F|nr:ribonuclease R [Saccharospirillum sp. MSK14-1]PTY35927.1 ribonuclease R [Saccharospirillum sp. MSK14-1]